MSKQSLWRAISIICVFCIVAAIGSPAQTALTTLHSFSGPDGQNPMQFGSLVQGLDGNFYGTATGGGANEDGTVFEITPTGTLTTLHSFDGTDGINFTGGSVVQATDGNFYGTTPQGGAYYSAGTVFEISPTGTVTTLYSFCPTGLPNCPDGFYPIPGLVQATDGNFYGTTFDGGANGDYGTIFKITPAGTLTTFYSFCSQTNCSDGTAPTALVQATDGNFYGTTKYGGTIGGLCAGTNGCGTVFRITPGGSLTTLHSFDWTDGASPVGRLLQATDGNFYGTTTDGGAGFYAGNSGTVFKITPAGTLTTLHSFCSTQLNCTDGAFPSAGLVKAADGNLYGTTYVGGGSSNSNIACQGGTGNTGCGTVFEITLAGTLTTLHSFDFTDGANPYGGVVQGTDGNLYGTTYYGGASGNSSACPLGCGTVFKLTVQALPAPTITSISPTSAIAGGARFTLTVNGTNFVSGSTVTFNGNTRTTTFVGATQLTAAILASDIATAGTFKVTVANPAGGGTSNAINFAVVTPQNVTGTIINSVNLLFSQGVLNSGQDNSLVKTLQQAIKLMNVGKNAGAIQNLDLFISEVNDLLSSGVLSPSQAASLVSAAESVIAQLS